MKGWSLEWIAVCFIGFAVAKVAGILMTGLLADRAGSTTILSVFLLPVVIGLVALAMSNQKEIGLIYFAGAGLSMGANFTLSGTIWAEISGVANLGAVRSMARSITFPASALAPAALGLLIDAGIGLPAIVWGLVLCMITAAAVTTCVLVSGLGAPAPRTKE